MTILEQIDEIGAKQKSPDLCKRYNCYRAAATSKGDCLICDAADRKARETVAQMERRGYGLLWLVLAVLAAVFTFGVYLEAGRP